MSDELKVCIIGPSPDSIYIGGVATHVKNLKGLDCLRNADVFDPGSIHSNQKTSILAIFGKLHDFRRQCKTRSHSCYLLNTSIYFGSFLKLILVLAFLPGNKKCHVFFHGGRFAKFNLLSAWVIRFFCRFVFRKVTTFYFLSKEQMAGFASLFPGYPLMLYANYSPFSNLLDRNRLRTANELKLLFVGRLVKEKGVFELLSAMQDLAARYPNVKLTIVGEGPVEALLRHQAKKMPRDLVSFAGFLSGENLENAYKTADVLVLPTFHPEGFPYVVIEAMRSGLPIVATNSGALETLVTEGVTGLQVVARNPESIVSAIEKILENPYLLSEMSKNCQTYFLKHLSRSAAEAFYTRLVAPIKGGI